MGLLFKRRARLTVGTVEIEQLAIAFSVTKNLKAEPNQAKVRVWNLNPSHRKALEEPSTLPCKLEIGYDDDLHVLYQGTVRTARTTKEGPSIITTVESGDGDVALSSSRVGLQIPPKATPEQILELVGKAMGIGLGNLKEASSFLGGAGTGPATVIHGRAPEAFTQFTRAHGLEWSVQDGALQVLRHGDSVAPRATLLSSDSGLVGSPSVDHKGVLTLRALIQPELLPGRLIAVESIAAKGTYRIEDVTFSGETHGTSWYADIHARKH